MTTLRVLLADAPTPEHEVAWALFDAAGACTASGRARPAALPRADRFEAIIAASRVRIAVIELPPMPASRLANAARFALEDQLADPSEAQQLAASVQQPDGRVRAVVVDRALLQAIARGDVLPQPARIVAESDLAAAGPEWRWCGSEGRGGFIRRPDGSAFPVDAPGADGALPSELALVLAQATRSGKALVRVLVDAPFADALLARWQRETGVTFRQGEPWHWHTVSPESLSGAIDLLPGARAPTPAHASSRPRHARSFSRALWIGAAALALHILATAGEWTWLKLDSWREAREWNTLAVGAGATPEAAAAPSSARAALSRRYAQLRHAQGLSAPDDALALLARAAPALATLPPGAVKSAHYADGHWTLELVRLDAPAITDLDARLRQAGVPALMAVSAASAKVRLGTL